MRGRAQLPAMIQTDDGWPWHDGARLSAAAVSAARAHTPANLAKLQALLGIGSHRFPMIPIPIRPSIPPARWPLPVVVRCTVHAARTTLAVSRVSVSPHPPLLHPASPWPVQPPAACPTARSIDRDSAEPSGSLPIATKMVEHTNDFSREQEAAQKMVLRCTSTNPDRARRDEFRYGAAARRGIS